MIGINIDMREFQKKARQMGVLIDDQLPYAIANTLNRAVLAPGGARDEIVNKEFPRAFHVRKTNFARVATQVGAGGKASKTQRPWRITLQGDKLKRGSLPQHADAGTKSPRNVHLAIPNKELQAQRTGRGMPARLRPRQIVKRIPKRALRITDHGIFQGEGGKLKALYIFSRSADIHKTYQFRETFNRMVVVKVREEFPKQLQQAVNSSFRR